MNLWILTIGSSDVQLDSDKVNRDKGRTEKQRSDKVWQYWYDDIIKEECYDIPFEPKPAFKDSEEPYRIPPRILGIVYESSSEEVKEEIQTYLTFPLLKNFVEELKQLEPPEAIAVLLTDQTEIFKDDYKRRKPKCPYWQDTCKLEPILNSYLGKQFPDADIIPLILSAQEEPGLDDWDRVLDLVRDKLNELDKLPLQPDTVYVSHQAGTPAISSGVQFSSLAKFRTNVQFLVSNEYSQETKTISRSTYLGAIQLQEAQALLVQHDYVGIRDILGLTKTDSNNDKAKRIKYLLDAAEQWNYAEFQKFKNILTKRKLLDIKEFPWYQSGYESAYLASIRLDQGSTVDALFHSFRAVEGSISKWVEKHYDSHILKDPTHGLQVKLSICQELPGYLNALSEGNQKKFQQYGKIGLYSDPLYDLLKEARPEWETHADIKIVWEVAKKERNNLFHRLEGLQELELFDAWNTKTKDDWKKRLLGCLNFIAKHDLPKAFTSLKDASLMAQVHRKLKEAIDSYKPE